MSLTCPKCSDQNTQRLSLAFESGISDVTTRTSGAAVGIGRGGIGIGIGSSKNKGTSQTALSQRAAPPKKSSYLKIFKYWFIATLLSQIFLRNTTFREIVAVTILVAAGYAIYRAFMFNRDQWPALHQTWQKSFICLRCSNIFEVD